MAAVKVLLVEDEGVIRMVVAEYLQDQGFEVTEARDGDEAAGLLDGVRAFDVLFTDVQMPGVLDGVDLAMHARRMYSGMPLVLASGYAPQLISRLGTLEPAAVFIGKPYELRQISATLKRLTSKP